MLASDDASDFALQDDFVICGPLFVLPNVCWKSGSTEDLRRVHFKIDQASFVFHSRPIEVIGYISKSQRQRDLWRGIRLMALLLLGLLLLCIPSLLSRRPTGSPAEFTDVAIVISGVSLICFSAVLHVKGRPVVSRYRAPNLHYVRGLPPACWHTCDPSKPTAARHRPGRPYSQGIAIQETGAYSKKVPCTLTWVFDEFML
ncbi:MAG UNVERIFIED_CONTAM: hypothetical protein LVR18_18745 [Planctomycetaceae bacterium]